MGEDGRSVEVEDKLSGTFVGKLWNYKASSARIQPYRSLLLFDLRRLLYSSNVHQGILCDVNWCDRNRKQCSHINAPLLSGEEDIVAHLFPEVMCCH